MVLHQSCVLLVKKILPVVALVASVITFIRVAVEVLYFSGEFEDFGGLLFMSAGLAGIAFLGMIGLFSIITDIPFFTPSYVKNHLRRQYQNNKKAIFSLIVLPVMTWLVVSVVSVVDNGEGWGLIGLFWIAAGITEVAVVFLVLVFIGRPWKRLIRVASLFVLLGLYLFSIYGALVVFDILPG